MRISDCRQNSIGKTIQFSATVAWEDCDLPAEELRFEVEGVEAREVVASAEAFAIRGALAALHRNEKRVLVEGSLCPGLRDDLRAALRVLRAWHAPDLPEPILEASRGFRALWPAAPQAGLFLSGGADSLFALRSNRLNFPPDHASSFRAAIFVPNFGARLEAVSSPRARDLLARQSRCVTKIARAGRLRLISAWSPSGELGEDEDFFEKCSHTAHLAAIGHLFSPILSSVSIATGYDPTYLVPWGSHPLLETNYGSSALEIREEGFGLTRQERVAPVGQWRSMLPHLIVCSQGPLEPGVNNCGRCEKCLRTMIGLFLADALRQPGPFPTDTIDVFRLEKLSLAPQVITFWKDFPESLRRRGRHDLARTVESLIADGRRRSEWFENRGWKGKLRNLDRRLLGGSLLAARRRLRKPERLAHA